MRDERENRAELAFYRVIAVPMTGSPAAKKQKQIKTVKAWGHDNAVAIACWQMDIHPKNYAFSAELLARVGASENKG